MTAGNGTNGANGSGGQLDVDVIKTTGQHTVTASLHSDVSFPITIDVVAAD